MGAWDELDTEITVDFDLSDLEGVLDLGDPYGIFDETKQDATKMIEAIQTGSHKGVEDLAGRDRSFQEQFIRDNCDNPSGMLASSINDEEKDEYTYLIGTRINHIYPMSVEYGRKGFGPIRAKALAFYADTGELIFRKRVGPAKPRPFVAPAYEKTSDLTEKIMLAYIGQELDKVMRG